MVHHNAKYATLMDAMRAVNDPQAVAVLAVLFQVGPYSSLHGQKHLQKKSQKYLA